MTAEIDVHTKTIHAESALAATTSAKNPKHAAGRPRIGKLYLSFRHSPSRVPFVFNVHDQVSRKQEKGGHVGEEKIEV
jgi:hypothetical protein